MSTLTCSYCGKISKSFENFWDISLDFPCRSKDDAFTLNKLLLHFMRVEEVPDFNCTKVSIFSITLIV